MLYLVHELSPMRSAVFLIEIYHPVSLNPPKWPLIEKSERFYSYCCWTLTLLWQYDGFRLTPWIFALVFLQILIQSVNSGKFHNRAVYSLVPNRRQRSSGFGLSQYRFFVSLSLCLDWFSLSTFIRGLKAPVSYHNDASLGKSSWQELFPLTQLTCFVQSWSVVDVDFSTLFGTIKNTGIAANSRTMTRIVMMAFGVPLSSSKVTEIMFDFSFA